MTTANKFSTIFLAYKYSEFESFEETVNYIQKNIIDEFTKEKLLRTLEKFYKAVNELSRIYQRKELRQALFNWQVRNYDDRNFKDVPDGIGKLAAGLLDIKDGEKVLNLNSSTFKWAVNVADNEKIFVCGVDESQDAVFIGNIRAALVNNRLTVKFVDALKENFPNFQADKVFVDFRGGRIHSRNIFNVELKNFGEKIFCKEWAYTVLGMLNQKSGGKTVALLPENVLTNAADKEIRKKLLDAGKIEGVISLHMFGGRQKNLLILSENNNSVKMLDATNFFTDGAGDPVLSDRFVEEILRQYNSESENFIEVPNTKVAENNFVLYPPRYLAAKKINFKSRPLSDFVKSIQRGAQQLRPHELAEMKRAVPTNYRKAA